MQQVKLQVDGMSCGHCVKAVEQAIATVDGAKAESVAIGTASVSFDPGRATIGALIDAVEYAGYEAREVE